MILAVEETGGEWIFFVWFSLGLLWFLLLLLIPVCVYVTQKYTVRCYKELKKLNALLEIRAKKPKQF